MGETTDMTRSEIVKKSWIKRRATFIPPFKGKVIPPEVRQRMRDGWARRKASGLPGHRLGIRHTEETKLLMSQISKERTPRGANHYAWKGGSKQKKFGDRAKPEYRTWRKAVLERDGYICILCSLAGICYREKKGLEVHHIKSWAKFPELRFVVSNGDTLCHYHHQYEVHNGNQD